MVNKNNPTQSKMSKYLSVLKGRIPLLKQKYRAMFNKRNIRLPNGIALLLLCSLMLFVWPLLPETLAVNINRLSFAALLLLASSLIDDTQKYSLYTALILVSSRLSASILDLNLMAVCIDMLEVVFLAWIAVRLIAQIIRKEPSSIVIVESISGYILLGISLTTIMSVIVYFDSNAFSYQGGPLPFMRDNNFPLHSYFVFITYTTVGYGDIVPVSTAARSLAKLTALTGQIYIAVVVAILIGKYLQAKD